MRKQVVQGILLFGVFLTLGGILTVIIGKAVELAANISLLAGKFFLFAAANPLIIAVGVAIGVLVFLMFKFKDVADVVFICDRLTINCWPACMLRKYALSTLTYIGSRESDIVQCQWYDRDGLDTG